MEDERVPRVVLLRHAAAGKRSRWEGDDRLRPLSKKGRRQAAELAAGLARYPVAEILTSPYLRCVQTVEPLAERLGIALREVPELAEGATKDALARLLGSLNGSPSLLCTHGDVVEMVVGSGRPNQKGGIWTLVDDEGGLRPAEYFAAPE